MGCRFFKTNITFSFIVVRRGRPKRRFMDAVKEDMQVVGVRVEDTKNRLKWKTVIRCGNP